MEVNLHFSRVGEKLASEIPSSNVEPESYLEATKTTFSLKDPPVSVVCKLLAKLNERKAGLLKMAGNIIAPSLTQIFIKSINTGIFPTDWKLGRVTPIFKKGKRDDQYPLFRPLPKFSKKSICEQFCDYLKDNNLLTHCQSGFRSLHSTLTALIEATNSWSVNIENGFLNGVIFIDLKKTFDTIDHTILIRKFRKYGVDSSSLKWFESYLCDRNQNCSTNGYLSNNVPVT